MENMKKLVITLCMLGVIALVGCEDNNDNAKVFDAQKCLNDLTDETDSAALTNCLNKLGSASTDEALALSCSIQLMIGGITTTKLVSAFQNQDDGANGSGGLVLALAYTGNDLTSAQAVEAECLQSGNQGLIGIASMVVTGTAVCQLAGCSGAPLSPTDITNNLSNCASTCSAAQKEAIGEAAVNLAESYCTDESDSEVCDDVDAAVASGASNADIANALLANLNN